MTVFTPVIKPNEILSSSNISYLKKKNSLMGAYLILHAWLIIFGSLYIYTLFPNFFTLLTAILIISGRQLGLAILMHEGAHGLLANKIKLNNLMSQFFCAFPMGVDTYDYRHYHLRHHKHTQSEDDPDLILSSPFPISKSSFLRKILRDLSGVTGIKQRFESLIKTINNKSKRENGKEVSGFKSRKSMLGIIICQFCIFSIMSQFGSWWFYFIFWVLPSITVFQLFYRIRNIAEHAMVLTNCDDFNNARTTYASFLERVFVAPYYVNYHLEHHLFMFVPCYKLKKAHQMLIDKNLKERMEIKNGYTSLLKAIMV